MGGHRSALGRLGAVALGVVPAAFVAIFFLLPVLTVALRGLAGVGGVLTSGSHLGVIWFTFAQAAASTALTLAVGLFGAAWLARMGSRAKRVMRAIVVVPFVLPTVVVAGAFDATFDRLGLSGSGGIVSLDQSIWAILIAHAFFNYAVVVRTVGTWWAGLDRRLGDAAASLGAKPHQVLRHVSWPQLRPAIAAAGSITFLFSFTSFGVILILGGPGRATLETEIYRFAITRIDFDTAAALALVQLVAVTALVVVSTRLERRCQMARRPQRVSFIRRSPALAWANVAVMAMLLGLPIGVLVEQAFSGGGGGGGSLSLGNFAALADRVSLLPLSALQALGNSLVFAVFATAIATAVGLAASLVVVGKNRAVARIFDLTLTLPLGVSAVTVGIGILLALDSTLGNLRSSRWIIPVAHALVGLPFVVRTLVPTLRSIDTRLREAAAVLGATPLRIWREIEMPIISRAVAVGAAFAFVVSLGEFGATSFLPRRPDTLTAPLVLFRLLGTPGEALRGQAAALAVVLMLTTALCVLAIESLRRTDEGLF